MPAFLLHVGATVICSHAGQAQPVTSFPRVKLGGQPVVTLSSTYTVAGCTLPPPILANGPCVTGTWISGATRVRAGGLPVLIASGSSVCAPTGTPLIVVATQIRVKGT